MSLCRLHVEEAEDKLVALSEEREELQVSSEDHKRLLAEREGDLARAKERMEGAIADLESKLATEIRNR